MKKNVFSEPIIEVINFEIDEILTASNPDHKTDEDEF